MLKHSAPWRDPLRTLASFAGEEDFCLLYSGLIGEGFGRYSMLALWPEETVKGDDWDVFKPGKETWFGYLGYGLKDSLEKLPADKPSKAFPLPKLRMTRYKLIAHFDHFDKALMLHAKDQATIDKFLATQQGLPSPMVRTPLGHKLTSNMTKDEYCKKVATIKDAIVKGDLYQANLTRKFRGEWKEKVSPLVIFNALSRVSPAPYSAFLKCGENYILSSSPELFLAITDTGKIITKPIKGSAPRSMNVEEDKAIREELAKSEKNQAENLMIVDLMRNDLSRAAEAGSIKVDSLFDITSYMTVHHMSSTITGQKQKNKSALDVVKACFPPGSMTGAPKIAAMEICTKLEEETRGVYSGAVGWFGDDGSAHLSVVIRTLLMNEKGFEFQVGGGIVADSTPEGEWKETLVKARGILGALGLTEETISSL